MEKIAGAATALSEVMHRQIVRANQAALEMASAGMSSSANT